VALHKGKVTWFNNYGFIGCNNGLNAFVHYPAIQTEWVQNAKEGDEVEFDFVEGQKGPQADAAIPAR
jgi:cold shock protein